MFPDAVIFRPSVIFGPNDNFLNKFATMARFSPMLPVVGAPGLPKVDLGEGKVDLHGEGGPKFQPVYVGDVADAFVTADAASLVPAGQVQSAEQILAVPQDTLDATAALLERLLDYLLEEQP